ncbi:hypothetical protein BC835DRAFT_1519101 [Cytidiella melzeri]|nr:hypothetical protein BC835DRAFT_1519101 [Cytidiella melzeri]
MSRTVAASHSFLNTPPRLPLELVHIILRNIDTAHDKPTISACTLVHSSWSGFSRRLLFQAVRLNALTMRHRPHEDYAHINMPDFEGFLAFMRDNPSLSGSVQTMEITGFVPPAYEKAASGDGVTDQDAWLGTELDVYDEFDWEWDWTLKELAGSPTACRWTKLPRSMLHALVSTPKLFPRLESLSLNSMFVEYGTIGAHVTTGTAEVSLKKLVLREVGTTANTHKAFIQLMNMFNPAHITLDAFPMKPVDTPVPQELASLISHKRTTSLELSGTPDVSYMMEVLRTAPSFAKNLTKLNMHVHHACEVGTLSNLLKTIGRTLKELSVDLQPSCYVAKPEVHMDHDTYVALMRNFTLFPCMGLQTFTLAFSVSFNHSGSSNALDCVPQLLATLPPSVSSIILKMNFVFVVQAAALNLNWSDVHFALARLGRQLRGGKGAGKIEIVIANEGIAIELEERKSVEALFKEKFLMIKDILKVNFSP